MASGKMTIPWQFEDKPIMDKIEEIDRLVQIADKCASHLNGSGGSDCETPEGLLLCAYYTAIKERWKKAEVDGVFDKLRLTYAQKICKIAGQDPDYLVTNMPIAVATVLGCHYSCPVLNYDPHPLWWFIYRNLPEMDEVADGEAKE